VKVADFGLAKLVGMDAFAASPSHSTGEGGTPVPGIGANLIQDSKCGARVDGFVSANAL